VDEKPTSEALRALRGAIAMDDLVGVIHGPPGQLRSFKVSRDGRHMASAAKDGRVRIWTLSDPGPPVVLPRVGGRALTLAFSPNGNRIAVGTRRGGVRLWSVKQGKLLHTLRVRGSTTTVRWSPTGKRLVSIGREGVRFWDLQARPPRSIRLVGAAAFGEWSPGGSRFATTTEQGQVRVWSQDGRPLARVRGHGRVVNLAFAPDGSTVRVVRKDGTVNDLASRGCQPPDRVKVTAASFSEDGRFAIFGDGGRVRVVQLSTCRETDLRTPSGVGTTDVALSQDGGTAVAAGIDGAARVWDVKTRALQATLVGKWQLQAWIVIRPAVGGGQVILMATDDGLVREWQVGALPLAARWEGTRVLAAAFDAPGRSVLAVRPGSLERTPWKRQGGERTLRRLSDATAAVFAPGGAVVAVRGRDESISVIRRGRGRPVRFRRDAPRRPVTAMAFSSDGTKLLITYADGIVHVRSAASGTILATLGTRHDPERRRRPYALFTADGRSVVVVDRGVRRYEWTSGRSQSLATLRPPRGRKTVAPAAAIFGHHLAAAFDDAVPRVWDLRSPRAARELLESSRVVSSMAFSPDGKTLATADLGGVRLWDTASLRLVATLTTGLFHAVSFSPDGRYVLASGVGVGAQIFPCRPCGDVDHIREAARRAVRSRAFVAPAALRATPASDARLRVFQPEPTPTIDMSTPALTSPAPESDGVPGVPSTLTVPSTPVPTPTPTPTPTEPLRRLDGAEGRFRTDGRHSAGTVRG
jgi:WD40 repeat protein